MIIIFSAIYDWLTFKLVDNENHQYVQDIENSMISKVYIFQFVNNYIGNFVCLYYFQNFAMLQMNLVTTMIVK